MGNARNKKLFVSGFLTGIGIVLLGTLGLVSQTIELITAPLLAPTRFLTAPLAPIAQDLPGLLNMVVFGTVSGTVYGILFLGIGTLVQKK